MWYPYSLMGCTLLFKPNLEKQDYSSSISNWRLDQLDHCDIARFHPFTEQQADALAIVGPANTFSDCRTDVDNDELGTQGLVLRLGHRVGYQVRLSVIGPPG